MIGNTSLLRRMLLGQLGILLVFALFAGSNFVWGFYKDQGNLQKALEHIAYRFAPLVDRYLGDQPNFAELKVVANAYSEWAADDVSLAKLDQLASQSGLKIVLVIQTKNGDEIFRNDTIHASIKIPTFLQGFHDVRIDGRDWKLASVLTPNGNHKILFGEPSAFAVSGVRKILVEYIVYPLAIFLPIAAILMSLVIRLGLKPLNRLTDSISHKDPNSLDPLMVAQPYKEMTPLVDSINNLMLRVTSTLARERRFLADAAHELRTPLAVIQAQAHLLTIADSKSDQQVAAHELDRGVSRVAGLIGKLLTSAQLNSEEYKYQFEHLEVNTIVKERIAALSIFAIKKGIDLSFHQTEVLSASISKTLFVSAFDNILENAIRYTGKNGQVEVSIRRSANTEFVVAVLDSGPSIAADKLDRVFERFFRVEGTEEQGSGLGLSIAQQAMHAHHGQVKLQAGPRGSGLLAELSAPLHDKTAVCNVVSD